MCLESTKARRRRLKVLALSQAEWFKSNTSELKSSLTSLLLAGGFKLWECALDLTRYLVERWQVSLSADGSFKTPQADNLKGLSALELGCGHGLPGILAVMLGMQACFQVGRRAYMLRFCVPVLGSSPRKVTAFWQDYNEEVLKHLTMPNLSANTDRLPKSAKSRLHPRFFSGDWAGLPAILKEAGLLNSFDCIFSSDTIYSLDSQPHLLACIAQVTNTAYHNEHPHTLCRAFVIPSMPHALLDCND